MKKSFLAALASLWCLSASAQVITPAPSGYRMLYVTGTSVGNGADTTQDTLQTFTLGAGQLANVGDTIHLVASGTFASSTDTKTARVVFGGQNLASQATATSGVQFWSVEVWIIKTGSSAQSYAVMGSINGTSSGGTTTGTKTVTDTAAITINITGQNSTNSVANSITCQTLVIEYLHQ